MNVDSRRLFICPGFGFVYRLQPHSIDLISCSKQAFTVFSVDISIFLSMYMYIDAFKADELWKRIISPRFFVVAPFDKFKCRCMRQKLGFMTPAGKTYK